MNKRLAEWVNFEDDVFRHVQDWLKKKKLSINPLRATAHRRKKYFSPSRNANIEFEIAIEAFDAGATEPSQVWVWECKDHRRSKRQVEVADIEILNDKIDQLGRSRFKGLLVTTHGYQSAAMTRAESCGIALFVLKKELHRVTKYAADAQDDWRELLIVSPGVTFAGREFSDDYRFEDALSVCLKETRSQPAP
jgi:hypothetical protein